jgi:hypothetical protein
MDFNENDWGILVLRINFENGIKFGFVLVKYALYIILKLY